MSKFVPRSGWGARRPRYVNPGTLSAKSTNHWNGPTVTLKGKTTWDHSNCAALVRGIQNFHMDGRGWADIAYNFVICQHGYIFEGRGFNVRNGANGTNDGNKTSHAVMCLAGGGNPFNEVEKIAVKDCVHLISTKTRAPNECIGHRDHKSTECPGSVRYAWVHAGMPISSAPPKPPVVPPVIPTKPKDEFIMDAEAKAAFQKLNEKNTDLENKLNAIAFVVGIDFKDLGPNDEDDRATLGQALAWAKAGAIKAFDGDAAAARREAIKWDPAHKK